MNTMVFARPRFNVNKYLLICYVGFSHVNKAGDHKCFAVSAVFPRENPGLDMAGFTIYDLRILCSNVLRVVTGANEWQMRCQCKSWSNIVHILISLGCM